MKNGAPTRAVMMPTSTSLGRATTRPTTSAAVSSAAPPTAEKGSSQRWSTPDQQPAQVRDDEADEADRPGDGGGRAAQQDRAEPARSGPGQGHPLAEPGGEVVAEGERVEAAGARPG